MKLHARTMFIQNARAELAILVTKWSKKHDLSIAEIVQLLLHVALEFQVYAIRDERHPGKPDKKGDEA